MQFTISKIKDTIKCTGMCLLSAKTRWQNGVTQGAVSCHLVSYGKSVSSKKIMFTVTKRSMVLNFK